MYNRFTIYYLKIIPIVFFILTCSSLAQTQPPGFLWALSGGGTGYDAAMDITADYQDNIIVTGYFDSTATFGGITLTSAGGSDIFLAKYDNSGNILWATRAGGNGYEQPYSVTTDNQGNIIITGTYIGNIVFGTDTLITYGNYDVFTAKYNSNGVFQWAVPGGGQEYDYGYEVSTDNQNNIIVTGTFVQFASFGDSTISSGNPYGDIFVVKYDPQGVVQWVKAAVNPSGGQSFYNLSYGVRTDNNNDVFITGSFSGVIVFGDTTLVSTYDGTSQDMFLAKYDALGTFQWVVQAGGIDSTTYAEGDDIQIDKDNNILVAGTFSGGLDFSTISLSGLQNSDLFIAKIDQSGNILWAIQDHGSIFNNRSEELALDAAGNIALISNITQGAARGEFEDAYFSRYTNSGQKLWGERAGLLNSTYGYGLTTDSRGDMYGCGKFFQSATFGNITLNGVNDEAFYAKLPSPKFSILPNPLNFGSVPVVTIDSALVQLVNASRANLHIFDMTLVNDTSNSFGIISGYPLDSIPSLQTANMEFAFIPVYTGLKTGYMEIVSDASTSPDTLLISGTGVGHDLTLSDTVLNFGSVDVGLSSPLNLSLINPSLADMVIDSVTITGIDASNFSFTPIVNGDTLTFLNYINLTVSFSPDTSGLKNADLIIYSTALSSPDTVILTGTGLSSIVVQLPPPQNIGQSTNLNITPPSSTPFTSSEIFYRKTGDIVYQQDTLSFQGNVYTYNIPPQFSTITGIQFYVMFSDGFSIVTYPSLNPETNPASIDVNVPQMNFPNSVRTGKYQMFSIPLSINAPKIDSVFADDYGPYDTKVWRIFRWQPESDKYMEHNAILSDIVPGDAFWLINRDGKSFDVNNSLSVPAFNNYTITIQPGYNQIGDPFAFPVDWSLIENSDLITQLPIGWDADADTLLFDQLILNPWEGYWVYNPLSQIINLNVNPNASLGKKQSANYFSALKSDEFFIQIKAYLKSEQAKDLQNYIGMMEDAGQGNNKYNIIKPPAINDQIKLLIPLDGSNYARNVVPVSKDGAYWDFSVDTKSPNQVFTFNINGNSSLPEGFNIWLLDRTRRIPININSGPVDAVTPADGKGKFRIIVGTEDFAKIHSDNISLQAYDYVLYQNYPNPFNPTTNISYQLKEKSNVTLEIFNILGERVMSIVNNVAQDPGQHIITWNGRNSSGEKVASGIYIYRIKANEFISSKKMILLK